MINLNAKQAAEAAVGYFNELFSGYGYSDIRLEEVEKMSENWLITLGYLDKSQEGFSLGLSKRRYKIFTVRQSDGEITSVKIRPME